MKVHDDFAGYQAVYEDENSFRWIWVSIARAGPGPNARASLWILGGECIFEPVWECTNVIGHGTIPARDVTGSFGSGMAVHTDLRGNPDFSLEGAEPGIVSIQWQRRRDGWYEGRFSGSSEWGWFDILTRQSGTWRSSAASAIGEVLGRRVPEEGWTERSELATGRQVIMEFERAVAN